MEKPKPICWADYSDDDDSETEETSTDIDPNKQTLFDSINLQICTNNYQFRIENLPYSLSSPSEILSFLDMSETSACVRLQYKGKKFTGMALVTANSKDSALKIAAKYNANFNSRAVLVLFKPEDSLQWIPQKKTLLSHSSSSTTCCSTPTKTQLIKKTSQVKIVFKYGK